MTTDLHRDQSSYADLGSVRIPRRAHAARAHWRQLTLQSPGRGGFDPDSLDDQPEALRRWVRRAVAPGVRIGTAVRLSMHGQLRLRGTWRAFKADQLIAPGHGYVWAATTTVGGLRCSGFDSYVDGVGQMQWKLLGLLPVVSAGGPDVSRSAAGRLAAECLVAPHRVRRGSLDGDLRPRRRARQVRVRPWTR